MQNEASLSEAFALLKQIPLILKPRILIKHYTSDTEASLLDLHFFISNDIVSTKIYDKRDDFDSEIVNFPF